MQLNILNPEDKILRETCRDVSLRELRLKETQLLINDLMDFIRNRNDRDGSSNNKAMTVGLSANQMGIGLKIMIVNMAIGKNNYQDVYSLINPKLVWSSKTIIERPEGCVNLPSIWGVVKRSYRIKLKAYDRSGNKLLLDIHGWPAILVQHELDHLNGALFIDHLSDPKHAHKVSSSEIKRYRHNYQTWDKYIDVSKLVKTLGK